MSRKSLFVLTLLLSAGLSLHAQDFRRQYRNARQLFDSKNYNLAMEAFKPLIVYDKDNSFTEYSSFYYAVSAYQLGYASVAKDMLVQIRNLYPTWHELPDVNFWLAKIYFDQHEYFQGMHVLQEIPSGVLTTDISMMKRHYLSLINDAETLRMAGDEFPGDVEVARALAVVLGHEAFKPSSKHQFDSLISHYNFPREEFKIDEGPRSIKKDKYVVSLLFPFLANALVPSPTALRSNQSVIDMYLGMKMAADTLAKSGINLELRAYDTERDLSILKKILDAPELKNSDLIVGPLFNDQVKLVQQFAIDNQINMFNPVSNFADYTADNPYAYLFQPSHHTLGTRAAELIAEKVPNKNCIVYFGDTPKDSIMAFSFMKRATELGVNIVFAQEHHKESAAQILSQLMTATEYDEWKNPKQFTLKLDSIGSVYVASDNPLIYSKVNSSFTARGDSVVIVGTENWISPDNSAVNFENLERIHVLMAAGNYSSLRNPSYIAFRKAYLAKHGIIPSHYAKLGYEFTWFVGNILHQYGTLFQNGLNDRGFVKANLYEGFDFSDAHDNQYVPFVYFRDGELTVLNGKY